MSKQKKKQVNKIVRKKSIRSNSTPEKTKNTHSWPDLNVYNIPLMASLIAAAVAIILSFAQYGQSLPYEFVLDDKIVLNENNFVKKGFAGIKDILFTEGFVGYFGEQKDLIPGARYRPLSLITFAIEYELFGGLNSWVNHLNNILLYGLCGWLLFITLGQMYPMGKKWWYSLPFIVLLIWMVHPTHTEVVANIKSRDEIMSLIFSCLSLYASLKFYKKGHWAFLLLSGFAFFLGLMSKETTLTFLAIIPAALYFFRKPNMKKMLLVLVSLIVPLILYLIIRVEAIGYLLSSLEVTDLMNNPFVGMSFMERMAQVFYVLLKYLGLSFIPYPLTHDYYPYQIPRVGWLNPIVLLSLAAHLAIGYAIIRYFFKRKSIVFPLFWYVASLSIASNIVINVGTTMNERFIFTPTVGTCIILVMGLQWLAKKYKLKEYIPLAIAGGVSIIYFLISFNRTQVWESALTLNKAAVEVSTNSARANSFMATALFNEAKKPGLDRTQKMELYDQGEAYAKRAIEIYPEYQNSNLMLAGIAGERHKMGGSLDDLLRDFKIAATNRPQISFIHEYLEYLEGRTLDRQKMMDFFYQVGHVELAEKKGNYQWALKFLNYAYELEPYNPEINFVISKAYRKYGDANQANIFLSRAVEYDPSYQNRK